MRTKTTFEISFLGAARTVTGSKYLIRCEDRKFMIDCGLFQGLKELRLKNWASLPVEASSIEAIILTHAHIDHSGYLPRLVRQGFRGRIYCSQGTFELAKVLLPDAARIMEEEASLANQYGYSKHSPALPLFSSSDASHALSLFHPVDLESEQKLGEHLGFTLYHAGHILGSSFCIFHHRKKSLNVGFSGDVGRPNDAIMKPPVSMPSVNYLVVESTYGNRSHGLNDPTEDLRRLVENCRLNQSVIVIPAFAVGRAQEIIFYLSKLRKAGKLDGVSVFLDSPMASSVTDLYINRLSEHRLTIEDCKDMQETARFTRTAVDSMAIYRKSSPKIIISASGMATGGRVLHHLKNYLSHPENIILFTGYQAAGTRGRALVEGSKSIKMHGINVPVSAQVLNLENLSAHADMNELTAWLNDSEINPRKVFITHGELESADALSCHFQKEFGWDCVVPKLGESFDLA